MIFAKIMFPISMACERSCDGVVIMFALGSISFIADTAMIATSSADVKRKNEKSELILKRVVAWDEVETIKLPA